jgi:hypothetical protein
LWLLGCGRLCRVNPNGLPLCFFYQFLHIHHSMSVLVVFLLCRFALHSRSDAFLALSSHAARHSLVLSALSHIGDTSSSSSLSPTSASASSSSSSSSYLALGHDTDQRCGRAVLLEATRAATAHVIAAAAAAASAAASAAAAQSETAVANAPSASAGWMPPRYAAFRLC